MLISKSSELELHDTDRNHDWAGDIRQHYSNLNIADLPNFIQQAVVNDENANNCGVNCQSMNDNQKRIFKRIESHYRTLTTHPEHVEPLRLIVMRTTGMGKSYLINIIRDQLHKIERNHNINAQFPVLMLAPTGVVAFNIQGVMIHSALSILILSNNLDLNGECCRAKTMGFHHFVLLS